MEREGNTTDRCSSSESSPTSTLSYTQDMFQPLGPKRKSAKTTPGVPNRFVERFDTLNSPPELHEPSTDGGLSFPQAARLESNLSWGQSASNLEQQSRGVGSSGSFCLVDHEELVLSLHRVGELSTHVELYFCPDEGIHLARRQISLLDAWQQDQGEGDNSSDTKVEMPLLAANIQPLLRLPRHVNLVRYHSFGLTSNGEALSVMTEYIAGGSLRRLLKGPAFALSERIIRNYLSGILAGVHTLHSYGIIHGALTTATIFPIGGSVKLADYGLRRLVGLPPPSPELSHSPPSAALDGFSKQKDIWMVGMVVLEMIRGERLHCSDAESQEWWDELIELLPVTEGLKVLLADCLCLDPSKRRTALELCAHPYFLTQLPARGPERITSGEGRSASLIYAADCGICTTQQFLGAVFDRERIDAPALKYTQNRCTTTTVKRKSPYAAEGYLSKFFQFEAKGNEYHLREFSANLNAQVSDLAASLKSVGDRYVSLRWLGGGGQGEVYSAFDRHRGEHVALKIAQPRREGAIPASPKRFGTESSSGSSVGYGTVTRGNILSFEHEYQFLSSLKSQFIVQVHEFRVFDRCGRLDSDLNKQDRSSLGGDIRTRCIDRFQENEQALLISMEWMTSGSVADALKVAPLHESKIRSYLHQALLGLQYLHENNVTHMDVKPDNMLLKGSTLKLADFGISKLIESNLQSDGPSSFEVTGTYLYLSPEAIFNGSDHPKRDIWALGCSVVQMATGRYPWSEPGHDRTPFAPMKVNRALKSGTHPTIPTHLSGDLQSLLRECFAFRIIHSSSPSENVEIDFSERPTTSELLHRYSSYLTADSLPADAEVLWQYKQNLRRFPHQSIHQLT
jgi:serine/threonine protein kinase